MNHDQNCECEICKNRHSFEMPIEVFNATIAGNLVVFAGAGISTETKQVFLQTFYQEIFNDLSLPADTDIDFPALMSKYCETNINGRQKLLQKIKNTFDYCHQYGELYHQASAFHRELSSIYYINSIVTTNWDDFFERECSAIPIVIPEDFAFHSLPDRKLYKIHGSISNYGTIIATKEDYDKCYKSLNKGIIGSYLKTILATKTVLFVGYSFRDFDFNKIFSYLKKELKDLLPHIFIVTLDTQVPKSIAHLNMSLIRTDGTFFLETLREKLEDSKHIFKRVKLDNVYRVQEKRFEIHAEISELLIERKLPNLVYCSFYQDGIQHSLSYLQFHSSSGKSFYPPKIFGAIETYEELRKTQLKRGKYGDVAYIDGYIAGLLIMVYDDDYVDDFYYYYLFGVGPVDHDEFTESIDNRRVHHKKAELYGERHFTKALTENSEIVLHHRPFLP
jgi:hypothetical protein